MTRKQEIKRIVKGLDIEIAELITNQRKFKHSTLKISSVSDTIDAKLEWCENEREQLLAE